MESGKRYPSMHDAPHPPCTESSTVSPRIAYFGDAQFTEILPRRCTMMWWLEPPLLHDASRKFPVPPARRRTSGQPSVVQYRVTAS